MRKIWRSACRDTNSAQHVIRVEAGLWKKRENRSLRADVDIIRLAMLTVSPTSE